MNHDLAGPQLLATRVAQPEPVAPQVDLDHRQLLRDELRESFLAQLLSQPFERGAGQHLLLEALGSGPACAGSDREVDAPDLRDRTEALLDDRLAEEAGAAGDQDGLALQGLGNQDRLILEAWLTAPRHGSATAASQPEIHPRPSTPDPSSPRPRTSTPRLGARGRRPTPRASSRSTASWRRLGSRRTRCRCSRCLGWTTRRRSPSGRPGSPPRSRSPS